MNIQHLRQSLKVKWLNYYKQNRHWLVKMRVWGSYDGLRRPSSGFIMATLSVLEPEFEPMLAFMMDLNNNPDAIVTALGLNFNPDAELGMENLDDAAVNYESELTEPQSLEEKPMRSLTTANQIVLEPPGKTQHPQQIAADLPPTHKPLPVFGVATNAGTPRQNKPTSSVTLTATVPRNGKNVVLAVEVPHHVKLAPRSSVASPVKSLPSLAVIPESSRNGKPPQNPQSHNLPAKTQPLPSTNASSLAAWIDEFCQGRV